MMLEDIQPGQRLDGVLPGRAVSVLAVQWHGRDAAELTFKTGAGQLGQRVVFRSGQHDLHPAGGGRSYSARAEDFLLAAQAQWISLAGLVDPVLAVATSDVQPLPHQLQAVYGELLPRTPLRFLLADDPGAGKTIMAGLYLKELILRGDVERALIVAPGGLVEQWQDELFFKFGLQFDLFNPVDAGPTSAPTRAWPLLITRMDQLARNEGLVDKLTESAWDLIVVDEAHRMAAHNFGGKIEKTKRFQLGERLGQATRHLLLMTATPHSGKEDDFQLFLTLLDRDRFEGIPTTPVDLDGIWRRLTKEDLLTFEGRRLFPERVAETVPYELSALEYDLYEQVTTYVRTGMNRAERLGGQRKNTVGFALTVLQRRLASSPEAIHRSLQRRAARLERRRADILANRRSESDPIVDPGAIDGDDLTAEQVEELEEQVVDSATASQTVAELDAELAELAGLISTAQRLRRSGADRKWVELAAIINDYRPTATQRPEKIIIFTEHRDTLNYLHARISALLGGSEAIATIHGGVARADRRRITQDFTDNPQCRVLLATDAAGEGLNLQAAHLMVNYDLPWNPNRIEQRFGRIHRIGQTEICRLWNLVAQNTREGAVFTTLLNKLDQMRATYGGKVFDVLGEAFANAPLRDLLVEAIQYGQLPQTRARMHEVIDNTVGEGLKELLEQRALAAQHLSQTDVAQWRGWLAQIDPWRMRPQHVETTFRAAFTQLGGRLVAREAGRYEVTHVPERLRAGRNGLVAARYARVTFDPSRARPQQGTRPDLLAPGHPLLDAVMQEFVTQHQGALNNGATITCPTVTDPRLVVGVVEQIEDGTGECVAQRLRYFHLDGSGNLNPAGPEPFRDCQPLAATGPAPAAPSWLATAEERAMSKMITDSLPRYLAEVQTRRGAELAKTRTLVTQRLRAEAQRLRAEAQTAATKERAGAKPRESSESLKRKADDLDHRLRVRLELLDNQSLMSPKPPRISTAALVLPSIALTR